jgi:hypothetical protein
VFIAIIVWFLHGIPCLLFFDISLVTNKCVNTNTVYVTYITIYLLTLVSFIPALVTLIFGYLTYRNIHLTRVLAEQQADRQLVRMTLIQVVLVVICITPYGVNSAYSLITSGVSKDANRLIKESFASTIFALVPYVYYAVCKFILCEILFYIFFLAYV